MHSLDISQQWLFGHGSQRPHFSSTDKGRQFYCLKVILPNLYWLHFLSFLDLTTRSVLVSFPLDGLSAYVFTTPRLSHFHCSLRRRLIPHRHCYFCNGAWSAIISPSHTSVLRRRSAELRLSLSPWRHLGLLCPVSVFTCRQKISKPQKRVRLTATTTPPHKYLWFHGSKRAHSGNDNNGTGPGLYSQGSASVPPLSK